MGLYSVGGPGGAPAAHARGRLLLDLLLRQPAAFGAHALYAVSNPGYIHTYIHIYIQCEDRQ